MNSKLVRAISVAKIMIVLLILFNISIQAFAEEFTAEDWIDEAHSQFSAKNYNRVIACYENVKEFDHLYELSRYDYYILAFSSSKLGEHEEAIKYCDNLLNIEQNAIEILILKGYSLGELNRHQEALECYNEAISIDPDDDIALKNRDIALRYLQLPPYQPPPNSRANCEYQRGTWWCDKGGSYSSWESVKSAVYGLSCTYCSAGYNVTIGFVPEEIGFLADFRGRGRWFELDAYQIVYPSPIYLRVGKMRYAKMDISLWNLSDPQHQRLGEMNLFLYNFPEMMNTSPDVLEDALINMAMVKESTVKKDPLRLDTIYNFTTSQ